MKTIVHQADLCVVGGGLSGMTAAISAARQGSKVVLIHDRPVLGGNASSEIRMWICGAHGENNKETGLLEEIQLENCYRNPTQNYSIWDSILYEKVRFQDNITLLLNCSCNDIIMDKQRIKAVKAWQLTTETWHIIEASLFADCSGDSILAPLSGAEFRMGREAGSEFNESIQPEVGDKKTMGMSCLIQARETTEYQPFIPPTWANKYPTEDALPYRDHNIHDRLTNFWWLELGGEQDSIQDTEEIRDELLKVAFGVWDHIKNHGNHGADNWVLDWVGFLPGKRESRRYVGDYVLTQNDVEAEGRFDDLVAYGGWTMDDHHPGGFSYSGEPTTFHPAPSPFGIPYRCLYSKNIENLFFAGRNISVTHAAMSATRVMATCALLGQAVGTAAAIAIKNNLTPRGVYREKIEELKNQLMEDDCYLPWNRRSIPKLTQTANLSASFGNPELLRDGYDRIIGNQNHCWEGYIGDWIEYSFEEPEQIHQVRFIFDSNLNRSQLNMLCAYPLNSEPFEVPSTLLRTFRLEALNQSNVWETIAYVENNYQRLVKLNLSIYTKKIRLIPMKTWGSEIVRIFSWDIK